MASILQKISVLISATLHSIVDRALQQNSVAVFDEYIRQAQSSMAMLNDALIDLKATVNSLNAKYNRAADEAAKQDLQIDQLLKAGKESMAKAMMIKMNSALDIAKTYQTQYEKQKRTFETLNEVVVILQAKVDTLTAQREQVATLLQLVKSKNIVARSIKDIEDIQDTKTAEIVERVKSQVDMADAKLEVATNRLSTQIEMEVGDVELESQLEERRARLGLN
jgi:phage shock protein A